MTAGDRQGETDCHDAASGSIDYARRCAPRSIWRRSPRA